MSGRQFAKVSGMERALWRLPSYHRIIATQEKIFKKKEIFLPQKKFPSSSFQCVEQKYLPGVILCEQTANIPNLIKDSKAIKRTFFPPILKRFLDFFSILKVYKCHCVSTCDVSQDVLVELFTCFPLKPDVLE